MKGYDGYSMSQRALGAYGRGLLPAGKMVAYLKKRFPRTFAGLTTAIFRDIVSADEWHHTSKEFNKTKFYSIDSVFEVRHELKAALTATKSTAALLRDLKRAGREYIVRGGAVWGLAEYCTERFGFADAVSQTLAMSADCYAAAVEAHCAGLAKIAAERNAR